MKKLTLLCSLLLGIGASNAQNTNYTVLHNFNVTKGAYPSGTLTLVGAKLYGTTLEGGAHDSGCIFAIDTTGANFKDIYDLNNGSGGFPYGGSLKLAGNRLYGMTQAGIPGDSGVIYSIDTNGTGFRKLCNFSGPNGDKPQGSLTLVGNKLFGMTYAGGASMMGLVFTVDTLGHNFKKLYSFTGGTGGGNPYGDITVIKDKLFGMTSAGSSANGNIFRLDSNGNNYADLYDFSGTDGSAPNNILLNVGYKFFGMTYGGGGPGFGNVFSIDTNGNSGSFNDILDFAGGSSPNGLYPFADVVMSNGHLYGTCSAGGSFGLDSGVVFKVDSDGSNYTELHSFQVTEGATPPGNLTFIGNLIYGVAQTGGTSDAGVIFRLHDSTSTAGINNLKNQASMKVYPNPSTGIFKLGIRNYESGIKDIEVYDITGQKVFSQFQIPNSQFVINLSNQPNGIYLYRVIADNGSLVGEGKLEIQK